MTAPIKLVPQTISDDFRFPVKDMLEEAKDFDFVEIAIVGTLSDGSRYLTANCNVGHILLMLARAQSDIVESRI